MRRRALAGMCRVEGELFIKLMKKKGGGRTGFGVGILAGLGHISSEPHFWDAIGVPFIG